MTAKDPEGDEFALRLPDKKVPFAISTDGQLTVNGPLDREQKDEYQFEVIGMDSYLRKKSVWLKLGVKLKWGEIRVEVVTVMLVTS